MFVTRRSLSGEYPLHERARPQFHRDMQRFAQLSHDLLLVVRCLAFNKYVAMEAHASGEIV